MIPRDTKDYVKIYENFLEKDLCKNIVEQIKNSEWEKHSFSTYRKEPIQYKNELSVSWSESKLKKELWEKLWYAIERYIVKDFNFKWFDGWNGYTEIRFNKYETGTKMEHHCDHIHNMFDGQRRGIPTLSIVGCLNNDYEGGDFIMWESEKIKIPEGAVLIFPSNFMYPHKVSPVTKGIRYSYVSWVY